MAKFALLIGVSDYKPSLEPLPNALNDMEEMAKILEDQSICGFDEVTKLVNPRLMDMQRAIHQLFAQRKKDDLALLFFSGHGIKDDSGRLYFATPDTEKDFVEATAVSAGFVQSRMSDSRCKRQVLLLDCCFSGAFATGMTAKNDNLVDIQEQLGGEGRAVLTSSSSTQYSFQSEAHDLSVYTCYLVEGLKTGTADMDGDGYISVDELHEYASRKVQEMAPTMKPKIFAVEEGFKIQLAKAPTTDPRLQYRKEVERWSRQGEISAIGRSTLDILRDRLRGKCFTDQNADQIEQAVLEPYHKYQKHLQQYAQLFKDALQKENPIQPDIRQELRRFQELAGLPNEDIERIEARISQQPSNLNAASSAVISSSLTPSQPIAADSTSLMSKSAAPVLSPIPVTVSKTPSPSPQLRTASTTPKSLASVAPKSFPSRLPTKWLMAAGGAIAAILGIIGISLAVGETVGETGRAQQQTANSERRCKSSNGSISVLLDKNLSCEPQDDFISFYTSDHEFAGSMEVWQDNPLDDETLRDELRHWLNDQEMSARDIKQFDQEGRWHTMIWTADAYGDQLDGKSWIKQEGPTVIFVSMDNNTDPLNHDGVDEDRILKSIELHED